MASRNKLEHSDGNYGENIYMSSNTKLSDIDAAKEATQLWYNEVCDYKHGITGFSMDTGHFTQVVWKDSRKFGIGVARSKKGVYVCGNYDPPGNYEGEFAENVLKA